VLPRPTSEEVLAQYKRCAYLSEVDDYSSTALYGYSDPQEYYQDCSSFEIDRVPVPLLVIQVILDCA